MGKHLDCLLRRQLLQHFPQIQPYPLGEKTHTRRRGGCPRRGHWLHRRRDSFIQRGSCGGRGRRGGRCALRGVQAWGAWSNGAIRQDHEFGGWRYRRESWPWPDAESRYNSGRGRRVGLCCGGRGGRGGRGWRGWRGAQTSRFLKHVGKIPGWGDGWRGGSGGGRGWRGWRGGRAWRGGLSGLGGCSRRAGWLGKRGGRVGECERISRHRFSSCSGLSFSGLPRPRPTVRQWCGLLRREGDAAIRSDTVDWELDWEGRPTGRWRAPCWVTRKRRRGGRRRSCSPLGDPLSLGQRPPPLAQHSLPLCVAQGHRQRRPMRSAELLVGPRPPLAGRRRESWPGWRWSLWHASKLLTPVAKQRGSRPVSPVHGGR